MRKDDDLRRLLVRYLKPYGDPPKEDVTTAAERLRSRMRGRSSSLAPRKAEPAGSTTVRWALAAAASLVIAAVGTAILWRPADAALYRLAEGDVYQGDTIRSDGGGGAVLALTDGSRVEMRSQSELSLEQADDGLRIRLMRGGIIVNAAKQRTGHLYVQTKDVTVSVVGTVFLVNAEEQGSRVAVIEGEVRVQQGQAEQRLLSGEQVATSPSMAPAAITDEITWSRNAANHLALLQQSAVAAPPVRSADVSAQTRDAFEAVSVRLSPPLFGGARDGSPPGSPAPARLEPGAPCIGLDLQVDARRYAVRSVPVHGLITQAYGRTCQTRDQIVGGPAWVRVDGYDIEAALPMGSPAYTAMHVRRGTAPRLQLMLQTMLVDRFKLALRREMREMAVYNLVVATPGKLPMSADQQNPPDRAAMTILGPPTGLPGPRLGMPFTTMAAFASTLQMYAGRPVIDRTELKGQFDISVQFTKPGGLSGADLQASQQEQLPSALEDQLGLRLEPARGSVEFLVIDRIERPSEN